jgi:uncharacterized protein (TIGR02147 family)
LNIFVVIKGARGYLWTMVNIFNYLKLSSYLKDFYTEKKQENSSYSYRYIASQVDLDASNIAKIFEGKRNLPLKYVEAFLAILTLPKREEEYFKTLHLLSKAKRTDVCEKLMEELLNIQFVRSAHLEKKQFSFYSEWQHTAIMALIYLKPFKGDFRELGLMLEPPINMVKAKASVQLLIELGLIKMDKFGQYELTHQIISTGEKWKDLAVRQFQKQTLDLAKRSLEEHSKESREISTLTFTGEQADLNKVKELTREYRKSIQQVIDDSDNGDQVFQLNIQCFPISQAIKDLV